MVKKLTCVLLILFSISANSAVNSPQGKLTGYFTGWSSYVVRVNLQGANYSEIPECGTRDGYAVQRDANDTNGFSTHVSALLAAFTAGKDVVLTLSGCVFDRPQIIGVSLVQ